jgi:hypothetical protein
MAELTLYDGEQQQETPACADTCPLMSRLSPRRRRSYEYSLINLYLSALQRRQENCDALTTHGISKTQAGRMGQPAGVASRLSPIPPSEVFTFLSISLPPTCSISTYSEC